MVQTRSRNVPEQSTLETNESKKKASKVTVVVKGPRVRYPHTERIPSAKEWSVRWYDIFQSAIIQYLPPLARHSITGMMTTTRLRFQTRKSLYICQSPYEHLNSVNIAEIYSP